MLFFREAFDDESSSSSASAEMELDDMSCRNAKPEIDPLSRYGPHAFIPYPQPSLLQPTTNLSTPQPTLTINHTSSWTYSGPTLSENSSPLPPSFHRWSKLTTSDPSTLLARLLPLLSFLKAFLKKAGVEHYWLTIRASTPTNDYDMRRWHVDDDFFEEGFGRVMRDDDNGGLGRKGWKVAATLLGPSTMFFEDNDSPLQILRATKALAREASQHACTSIRCLGCATYAESVRESLSAFLADHATVSPGLGEVAFFRLGEAEGAVHSEPKCDVDRVFVNVVPGSEEQLRGLMSRWGMEWPRSWCVGLPGDIVVDEEMEEFVKEEKEGEMTRM